MATEVDPLRSTLDHLALDPRARSDRPYLITMLRRLGYSEAEIALYLGDEPKPEPAPRPAPQARPAPEPEPGERVIEIEYTGPGLRPFQLIVPMSEEEAADYDPLGLGAGLEAGSMTIEGDPDEDELSSFLEGEGAISFDDEFAGDDEEFEAEADRDNDEIAVRDEDDGFMGFDDDNDEMEDTGPGSPGADDETFSEEMEELEEVTGPFDADDDGHVEGAEDDEAHTFEPEEPPVQKGRKLVSFTSVPLKDATVRRLDQPEAEYPEAPPTEATGDDAETLQEGWAAVDDEDGREEMGWDTEGESWPQDEGAAEAGYWYNDWLLHSREEDDGEGGRQRVYFFAKGQSPNGTPASMPEGYEVATNKETGLPYLRPLEGEDAPSARKRIRMRRVQAGSQQEAEEALRREGRNVLGSMPVDIQEEDEEETP